MTDCEKSRQDRLPAEGEGLSLFGNAFSLAELASDRHISNATELLIDREPLVKAAMRAAGVEEALIEGDASDLDRLRALSAVAPQLSCHHAILACHMALSTLFDCNLPLNEAYCDEIWQLVGERLAAEGGASTLLARAGVVRVSDPLDPLLCPPPLPATMGAGVITKAAVPLLRPIFAPLAAFGIKERQYGDTVRQFGAKYGITVCDFASFCRALSAALDVFWQAGCRSAYHCFAGYAAADAYHADEIFRRAIAGKGGELTPAECALFSTWLMGFLGREYRRRKMALRLSVSAQKVPKRCAFSEDNAPPSTAIAALLSYLSSCGGLPRTFLDLSTVASGELISLCGSFAAEQGVPRVAMALDAGDPTTLPLRTEMLCRGGCLSATALLSSQEHGLLAPFFLRLAEGDILDYAAKRCEKYRNLTATANGAERPDIGGLLAATRVLL